MKQFESAIALALMHSNNAIESYTPYQVTFYVEKFRRYQLSGCNMPSSDIKVEVVYYVDNKLKKECIGFIQDTDSIDVSYEYLHKLVHDDLKVLRGEEND